jgi:Trehalose-phosphatase
VELADLHLAGPRVPRGPMNAHGSSIGRLPHALADGDQLAARLAGRRPAVFLDDDGTLTPIVDRPEDALISASMRAAVHALAARCTACVVSLGSRGIGILVADDGDPELSGRSTAAAFWLHSCDEVERFLDGLAREQA